MNPINTSSKLPLYQQVADSIKYKIIQGDYEVGGLLQPEMELCKIYQVSRITMRRAMQELEQEGYLTRQAGKGTFVNNWLKSDTSNSTLVQSFTNELREIGKKVSTKSLHLTTIPADAYLSSVLGVEEGSKVICLKRVRMSNGDIIAYSESSFPYVDSISLSEDNYKGSLYAYLSKLGYIFNYSRDMLEAISTDNFLSKRLEVEEGTALLKRTRISKCIEKNYTELNVAYYIGSKYKFHIELK